eukprot:260804_1
MARGHPDYDDQLCSVCDGTIKKWGEVPIDDVLTGRCSWCLHMSVHTRRMNNYVRRDTYRCGACDSRTAICLHCNSAFSRCDTWYDDKTCIKCQGIIPDWETQDENLRIMDAKSIEIRSANDTSEPFVPLRKGCWCRPLIDGEEFMSAVVDALDHAERVIYLCFWHLNDRIYLRRDGKDFHLKDRLDIVLQKKAQEGVQIYILLWREFLPTITLNNFSKEVKRNLSLLHDNIHIIRHGIDPAPGVSWVQHQKFVVVDEAVAFIGGLDICLGRWDTPEHRLIDPDKKFFLGVDYYNPFIGSRPRSLDGPAMFEDVVQRASSPRMPWHDVDVEVRGEVARDVAVNFVQRWNHHKRQRFFKKDEDPILEVSSLETIEASRFYRTGTCNVQCIRSMDLWSGADRLERSIEAAYVRAIKNAQFYIYIENQYFSSSCAGGAVKNTVVEHIVDKLVEKIEKQETFRVIFILPQPEEADDSAMCIMQLQYQTINRGGYSVLERLSSRFPSVDLRDYITFFFLRRWDFLGGVPVTEKIFVHAKIMIVDDEVAIISSANFNDRSFLGSRDSEFGVTISDEERVSDAYMDGKRVEVGAFARDLRIRLWKEHLCLSDDQIDLISDPIADSCYNDVWLAHARWNTPIFEAVFPNIPSDEHTTLKKFKKAGGFDPTTPPTSDRGLWEKLKLIKSHVTFHPIGFLIDDEFSTPPIIMELTLQDQAFQ